MAGRNPSSLKNEELKFWLRCRGIRLRDQDESMPRKMVSVCHCFDMWPQNSCINNFCFDHRVQEYIKSGSDKVVVDPDPDKIYTKRKNRLSKLPTNRSPESPAPKYPSDGWGNSLERMPHFTRAEMNQDIESSRKSWECGSSLHSNKLEESKDIFKGRAPKRQRSKHPCTLR